MSQSHAKCAADADVRLHVARTARVSILFRPECSERAAVDAVAISAHHDGAGGLATRRFRSSARAAPVAAGGGTAFRRRSSEFDDRRGRRHDHGLRPTEEAGVVVAGRDGRRGSRGGGGGGGRVLGLGVAAQVDLALERARANAARERLEAGVLAAVRDEVRRLAEGLAALTTHVRLLTYDTIETHTHTHT